MIRPARPTLAEVPLADLSFAQEVNAFTYSTLESYLPLAAGYLMLTLPLSALARWLESRVRFEA
jgi:ABC-type amino acid transport system permease subunit